jgi:hypothetical protein
MVFSPGSEVVFGPWRGVRIRAYAARMSRLVRGHALAYLARKTGLEGISEQPD